MSAPPVAEAVRQESHRPSLALSTWCIVAAFGAYFCTYAFRKPFTAASYEGEELAGVDFKTVLVTAQMVGYMVSKFLGIKVIAEMKPERRGVGILLLVGLAETALLLFGIVPPPYNLVFLALNGLPLGMVFGLVLGFLEGRRATEALTAGLCASFIVSDGVVKSVGAWLLNLGISPYWMPSVAGLLFLPPLVLFVAMLMRIPAPDGADIAHRSERAPMNHHDRRRFFAKYAVGLLLLAGMYLLITILRSIRADFAPEIWRGLGYQVEASVYGRSEMVVAFGVVLINGATVLVVDNRLAFSLALGISLAGLVLLVASLAAFHAGLVGPFAFMVAVGLGLYIPYVAVHTTIFERLIALLRDGGNLGYLMYLVDAIGYLGFVAVLLGRNYLAIRGQFIDFFLALCWFSGIVSLALTALAWCYFLRRTRPDAPSLDH